jgi:NitT/TauT family transport system substrate-binding protein
LAIYNNLRESISLDGLIADDAAKTSFRVMAGFDPLVKSQKVDISKTYINSFAMQSKLLFDA